MKKLNRRTILAMLTGFASVGASCLDQTENIRVRSNDITIIETSCSDGVDFATVEMDNRENIVIKGSMKTNKPCDDLTTAAYTSDNSKNVIIEIISATANNSDCQPCNANLKYEAEYHFHPRPEAILVHYISNGEQRGIISKREIER